MPTDWSAMIPKHAEDEPERLNSKCGSEGLFFDGGKRHKNLGAERDGELGMKVVDEPSELLRESRKLAYARMAKQAGDPPPWVKDKGEKKDDDEKKNPFAKKDDDDAADGEKKDDGEDKKKNLPPWMNDEKKEAQEKLALSALFKAKAAAKARGDALALGYGRAHSPDAGAAIQRRELQHRKFKGLESPDRVDPMYGSLPGRPPAPPRASAKDARQTEEKLGLKEPREKDMPKESSIRRRAAEMMLKEAGFLDVPTGKAMGKAVARGLGYGSLGVGAAGVAAGVGGAEPLLDFQTGEFRPGAGSATTPSASAPAPDVHPIRAARDRRMAAETAGKLQMQKREGADAIRKMDEWTSPAEDPKWSNHWQGKGERPSEARFKHEQRLRSEEATSHNAYPGSGPLARLKSLFSLDPEATRNFYDPKNSPAVLDSIRGEATGGGAVTPDTAWRGGPSTNGFMAGGQRGIGGKINTPMAPGESPVPEWMDGESPVPEWMDGESGPQLASANDDPSFTIEDESPRRSPRTVQKKQLAKAPAPRRGSPLKIKGGDAEIEDVKRDPSFTVQRREASQPEPIRTARGNGDGGGGSAASISVPRRSTPINTGEKPPTDVLALAETRFGDQVDAEYPGVDKETRNALIMRMANGNSPERTAQK
jgi:hypothetical protein